MFEQEGLLEYRVVYPQSMLSIGKKELFVSDHQTVKSRLSLLTRKKGMDRS